MHAFTTCCVHVWGIISNRKGLILKFVNELLGHKISNRRTKGKKEERVKQGMKEQPTRDDLPIRFACRETPPSIDRWMAE